MENKTKSKMSLSEQIKHKQKIKDLNANYFEKLKKQDKDHHHHHSKNTKKRKHHETINKGIMTNNIYIYIYIYIISNNTKYLQLFFKKKL